jgi:hypothetical protein
MSLAPSVKLVRANGSTYSYTPSHQPLMPEQRGPFEKRIAFAAAHVVVDPFAHCAASHARRSSIGTQPSHTANICGRLGLAWPRRWTRRNAEWAWNGRWRSSSSSEVRRLPKREGVWSQVGQEPTICRPARASRLQDVTDAYLEQCEAIEAVGGRIILMASRALAAVARDADDYASVYAKCAQADS